MDYNLQPPISDKHLVTDQHPTQTAHEEPLIALLDLSSFRFEKQRYLSCIC